ncbi:MAG: succinylglutamate desuccinylase/aspartoacylase family protein [Saprospiraceae bacterium]
MEKVVKGVHENVSVINNLIIADIPFGEITSYWFHIVTDGIGMPVRVPVIVARGLEPGPTLGVTAAIHGNELNGIPVIQRLFKEIDPKKLKGMIIGVPVVNVPSLLRKKRRFIDNVDLNHIMPGTPYGNVSNVYAYRFFNGIVKHMDYLIDLHTASFGRINSYYIRASMHEKMTRKMALLQNAQIIVHNLPSDGTLRGAADEINIPAITLEVGDPNTFQKGMIRSGLTGIHNVLIYLQMTTGVIEEPRTPPIICERSYWMYTDTGGILRVKPNITEMVKKGDIVATLHDIFGHLIKVYVAPEDGVVIGKSASPINQTGGRILHLGIVGTPPGE